MRLVDADAAVELLQSLGPRSYRREKGTIMEAMKMLSCEEYTPTIEAVPMVHGHWTREYDCSECGMPAPTDDRISFIDIVELKFCPYCGAKIDENEWAEEEETD